MPEFVAHARCTDPGVPFRLGTFDELADRAQPVDGVFSWYSLIHLDPCEVPRALDSTCRITAPGGSLLLAFFDGEQVAEFDHAVAPAFYWPRHTMSDAVRRAGFTVTKTEHRHHPGQRPHAALVARRD